MDAHSVSTQDNVSTTPWTEIQFVYYTSEEQLPGIQKLMEKDLSEPYSIYTYRYFINNWPKLCWMAIAENECVGAIVCKLEPHKNSTYRGYIAMLAVNSQYRHRKIGTALVVKAINVMKQHGCNEVSLPHNIIYCRRLCWKRK